MPGIARLEQIRLSAVEAALGTMADGVQTRGDTAGRS